MSGRGGKSRPPAADRRGPTAARGSMNRAGAGRSNANSPTAIVGIPVSVGERIRCAIVGMTHEGEGVGRVEGYTLFVHGALPGEQVEARVVSIGKSFGKARLIRLLEPSPSRVAAPCAIYDSCGGCQLQHHSYEAQLQWKRQHVVDSLVRIGKIPVAGEPDTERIAGGTSVGKPDTERHGGGSSETDASSEDTAGRSSASVPYPELTAGRSSASVPYPELTAGRSSANVLNSAPFADIPSAHKTRPPVLVHSTIGMTEPWRYRNKAQVPIGAASERGGLVGGFYEFGSNEIVDMDTCLIQQAENEESVRVVKEAASLLGVSAYDRESGRGLLRHVVVRHARTTGQRMIVLVTNGRDIPHGEEFVSLIRARIPGVVSICQSVNTARTPVVLGEEDVRVLWGEEVIYDEIDGLLFAISARSFFQVNPVQTEKLYGKAVEYAALTGSETVVDAYCGIGTISLFLARYADRVYGVEIVPEAIADAKRNARLNRITNTEFAVGAAEKILPQWQRQGITPDVIVVDPPRKGCDSALIATMLEFRPSRIVYVSCNPATLARDLRLLEDGGYRTVEVQPVDMFPHTTHVECVIGIQRIDT